MKEAKDDKVKKICEALRIKTLEPAQNEAIRIIEQAKAEAAKLIEEARSEQKKLEANYLKKIAKKEQVFQTSLRLAAKKFMEDLRQNIVRKIFRAGLVEKIDAILSSEEVIGKILEQMMLSQSITTFDGKKKITVPQTADKEKLMGYLLKKSVVDLDTTEISFGDIKGGLKLRIDEKNLTIDCSSEAISAWMQQFLRDDFHTFLFDNV